MSNQIISIIVPVYKIEKYLNRCVDSILKQTYSKIEVILVDDGSPDRCPQMCDEWKKRDFRVKVIHKVNGGLSSARNEGLKIANGEFIAFVDSDDWIDPEMYEYLYRLLKLRPECQIAQCEICEERKVKKGNKVEQPKEEINLFDKKKMLDYFFRINGEKSNSGVWNKLIRREILEDFTFVETLNEDVEATYDFFNRADNMISSNRKLYHYQINLEGITHSQFTENDLEYLKVWDRIVRRVEKENPDYYKYALINRKRADFTMLSKLVLYGYDKKDSNIHIVKRKLKQSVKESYWDLIKWRMPITRKVLMTLLVIF